MVYFQKVENNSMIKILSQLAIEIFKDHYVSILGEEQVEYMVKIFHTPSAIKKQISHGCNFYLVYESTNVCGFFAIEKHGSRMFLSKLYLAKSYRHKGIGKEMIEKIFNLLGSEESLYLHVNKHNDSSIGFYEKVGFKKVGEIVTDIGDNYVMDDYIYEIKVIKKSQPTIFEKVSNFKEKIMSPIKNKK